MGGIGSIGALAVTSLLDREGLTGLEREQVEMCLGSMDAAFREETAKVMKRKAARG